MTISAGDAPALDRRTILDIPADSGDVFGAAFGEAFSANPSTSLVRLEELATQEQGRAVVMGPESYLAPNAGRMEPETPLLDAQQARDRVAGVGFDIKIPDQGIREGALDVLIERHREQAARQQIMVRANGGSMPTQIAAGLAASILDPLNIASAFVPVFGEARYASMLANASGTLGRAGVRAGVGSVEGMVGAAIIEPLPLLSAHADQTEYGLSDTLANIAFGGILGGGLHTAGGALSDSMLKRAALGEQRNQDITMQAARSAEQQISQQFDDIALLGDSELSAPDGLMRIQNAQDFAARVNRRAEFDDSGRATYADGTAYGQEDSGREVDVQSLFDLQDPTKAVGALENIKRPQLRKVDAEGVAESRRIYAQVSDADELAQARAALTEDETLTREMLEQLPADQRAQIEAAGREEMSAAQVEADKSEQYSKAYRAAAICDLRRS